MTPEETRMQQRYLAFNRTADPRGLTASMPVSFDTEGAMTGIAKNAGSFAKAYADKRAEVLSRQQALADALLKHQQALELAKAEHPVVEKAPDPLLEEKWALLKAQAKRAGQPPSGPAPKPLTAQKWQVDNYNGIRARGARDRTLVGIGVAKAQGFDPETNQMIVTYDYDTMKPEVKQAMDFSNQIAESVTPGDPKFKDAILSLNTLAAQASAQKRNDVATIYDAQAKYLRNWQSDRAPVSKLVENYAKVNGTPAGTQVEPGQTETPQVLTLDDIEAELRARGALPPDTAQ